MSSLFGKSAEFPKTLLLKAWSWIPAQIHAESDGGQGGVPASDSDTDEVLCFALLFDFLLLRAPPPLGGLWQ
jgi:hypothetical protein